MKFNLDLYNVFYVVAKNGSISNAAKNLMISQPAISSHIKNLEELLGVSLFTRTKQGVNLTDEGIVLYEYVKNGIESIINGENALSNLKNLDSGTIRIGASTTICRHILISHLEKFHKKYPKIEIKIINNITSELLKELRNGNLDIVLLYLPIKQNNDLNIITISEVHNIFISNKKYYDLIKGNLQLKDLSSYPLIFPKLNSNTRIHLNNYLKDNNITLNPQLEIGSHNLIIDLVKKGFGIGYVTKEFIKTELENNSVCEIKVIPKVPKRLIGIVTLNKKTPNFSTQKLIEMITSKNIN